MATSASGTEQLRVSHIWRDEVMSDVVLDEPQPVTLGTTSGAKVTIPDLGLPENFAILRPGARGYLLTLSRQMRGRVSLGNEELEVEEFLSRPAHGEELLSDFKGKSLAPGDWGVVHLDASGEHSIFFQFVKSGNPLERAPLVRDADLLWPAFGFAFLLIGFFLTYAFWLYEGDGLGFVWPGNREMVANYLLTRPPPAQEETVPETKAGKEEAEEATPASTVGKEAKAGGEGDKERKRDPNPAKGEPNEALPESIEVGLLSRQSRKTFEMVRNRGGFDKSLGKAMARITGPANDGSARGFGDGRNTGVGPGDGTGTLTRGTGDGTGGGGTAHEDVETQGKLDTGGKRAARGTPGGNGVQERAVIVSTGTPSGTFGGLTQEQIMKVVRSRARAIQACYARELQRNKGLSGKIVVNWRIDTAGTVKGTKVRSTTMRNGKVEDCILREVQRMKFPSPKGGGSAQVNFPFIFGSK